MTPRIETIPEKKLVGMLLIMSNADYRIAELWKKFMPCRKEIANTIHSNLISLANYSPTHFTNYLPTNEFERWAAVEVRNFAAIPSNMETCILPAGMYAVFIHKGLSTDHSIYHYIYDAWLQNSNYYLDSRPHFEILGENYLINDPHAEEEIWIPICTKQ